MRKGARALAATLVVASALLLLAACDGDGAGGETTATMPPVVTQLPTLPPTAGPDIRNEDLATQAGLTDFIASAGGEVASDRIIYADVTGDGVDDAVVPVSSGGEGGDIAVFVYGYVDGEVEELLSALPQETRAIMASVEDGQLVTTEGVFAPGDPINFPSQLLHRYYRWDGSALAVEREEQEPAR